MSTKSVAEKLRLRAGTAIAIVADDAQRAALGPLPEGARVVGPDGEAASAVLFVRDAADLDDRIATADAALRDTAPVWIVYPKGNRADINRDSIWRRVEEAGWTLVANVAVDDVWSAVRMKRAT
ncbi:DUF3052 family protein [Microbacterium sp. No. 7]|uniref:DUF3052 family protein n=1 Tax=Microbacterium sp. No. 7 TaxID=1714373 RepID=UPI0006CFFC45|nr:DUF3052 family protein [Microbacterium sp. No. 7]ALJ22255.1 hypothetical protein AOA12_21160 [Microbacterium sp. No. 7]